VTVPGTLNTTAALPPKVCAGAVKEAVVDTIAPAALLSATFSVVASPVYLTKPAIRKACRSIALPLSVRLVVPDPLTTDTFPSAVACSDLVPLVGATLSVNESVSSPSLFPSPSSAPVNTSDETSPTVILKTFGRLLIAGAKAKTSEVDDI
jgi:hypothetical protein